MNVAELLAKMQEYEASDLYLTTGSSPVWRGLDWKSHQIGPYGQILEQDDINQLMAQLASVDDIKKFNTEKELNIAFKDKQGGRYRINFFCQQQKSGIVIRRVRSDLPSLEGLGLPEQFKNAIMTKRGLVLVSGQSGSGKSTSIAAMLNYLNHNASAHVITIEDPIEYVHEHNRCLFTQREVGLDTNSWQEALKNALRQRPDVIYIGEIRDAETMQHAINFAETGHLCIATIHSTHAAQAVERVANFFPPEVKHQYLYSLAYSLRYIFAQRLVTGVDGGKQLATEILENVGFIRPLIMKGAITEINDLMYKNIDIGMQTFEQSLISLQEAGKITEETAIEESDNPDNMRLELMRRKVRARHHSSTF
jgi:twitching motility protein PilU